MWDEAGELATPGTCPAAKLLLDKSFAFCLWLNGCVFAWGGKWDSNCSPHKKHPGCVRFTKCYIAIVSLLGCSRTKAVRWVELLVHPSVWQVAHGWEGSGTQKSKRATVITVLCLLFLCMRGSSQVLVFSHGKLQMHSSAWVSLHVVFFLKSGNERWCQTANSFNSCEMFWDAGERCQESICWRLYWKCFLRSTAILCYSLSRRGDSFVPF